jgi:transposase-like protein
MRSAKPAGFEYGSKIFQGGKMEMNEHIDKQENFSMNDATLEQASIKSFLPADSLKAFNDTVLSEDACRRWFLGKLHPDGINCPRCKKEITSGTTVKNFWSMKRCLCNHCGKRFLATDGTILHKSRLSMTQVFALAILLALGIDNKSIAGIIGIHPDSVRLWRMRFDAHRSGISILFFSCIEAGV